MKNIIINGAKGRMGKMLCETIFNDNELNLFAGVDLVEGNEKISSYMPIDTDAVVYGSLDEISVDKATLIDFTFPKVTLSLLKKAINKNYNMVIGSTGFTDEEIELIKEASKSIAIVFGYNMSLGVNLLAKAVKLVASKLPYSYDVEIIEAHHRFKKDSPSGTAIKLLNSVEAGREDKNSVIYGREGRDLSRSDGEIAVHAVRGGDIVGDHEVMFLGQGERLILKHVANSRMAFVSGAVMSAKFLQDKDSGLYTMDDVLGF